MPQTTYSFDPIAALAGLVVERGSMRGRYECSEDLKPGRLCEVAGAPLQLRQPQGTSIATKGILGGVPYRADLPPGGYTAGTHMVSVLREGQMWLEYGGTVPVAEEAVNVMHSSTIATDRGKVTASATSAGAGTEISAVQGLRCIKVDTTLGLALCELNLPAN